MVDSVPVDSVSFDQLFREARTFSYFLPKPVAPATLQAIHELLKWGPTACHLLHQIHSRHRPVSARRRATPRVAGIT